jgi:hypothetical protein
MWLEKGVVEVYHSTKFRGAGFKPFYLKLEKVELVGFDDNFGNIANTVVAVPSAAPPPPQDLILAGQQVYAAYIAAMSERPPHDSTEPILRIELRDMFMAQAKSDNPEAKQDSLNKAFSRGLADVLTKHRMFELPQGYTTVSPEQSAGGL